MVLPVEYVAKKGNAKARTMKMIFINAATENNEKL